MITQLVTRLARPWTPLRAGLLAALLLGGPAMLRAVSAETPEQSPDPRQETKPEAQEASQTETHTEGDEQAQAEADARHPNLLDGTLSGRGDQEESDSPHSGLLRRPTLLEPWFGFKQQLSQDHGLTFGGSYGVLWQNFSSSPVGEHNAVGGKLTLNLGYQLLNRHQPNALWVETVVEDRRPLGTDLAPLHGGFAAGSATATAATWGEFDIGVTQFYLRQNLFENRFQYAIGRVFAPNFVNAYPFFDDNRQFFNQQFATSTSIPVPLRGAGAVAALYPVDDSNLYLQGGMYTTHSRDTGWTIDDFFTKNEHFYHFDVGWSGLARTGIPIQARGPMDRDNYHVTAWYKNAEENGLPEAYGLALNANRMVGENCMVFLRGGCSDGWLIDWSASAGFGWRPQKALSDLLGVGIGWSQPDNRALRDQYTAEVFYRFHVTPNLAVTPDVQLIVDPALDPSKDTLWVFGLRARVTF